MSSRMPPSTLEVRVKVWHLALPLVAALAATSFTATNPEYNGSGVTDLAIVSISLIILGCFGDYLRQSRAAFRASTLLGILFLSIAARSLWEMVAAPTRGLTWCQRMPAYWPKLECLLHLSFTDNPGIRQLLFHGTALLLFMASFALIRAAGEKWRSLVLALLIPNLIWAVGHLLGQFGFIQEPLLGRNIIQTIGYDLRLASTVISNPGWLWTLLIPGFTAAVALSMESHGRQHVFSTLCALLGAIAIFSSHQRGGYLALAAVVITVATIISWRRSKSEQWHLKVLMMAALIATCAIFLMSLWQPIILGIGRLLNVPVKVGSFVSSERLAIWSVAWTGVKQHLFLGHGYASWTRAFSQLVGTSQSAEIYDTAHNFWVQLIFELGLIHGLIGIVILGLVGRIIMKPVPSTRQISNSTLLLTVVAALATFVQEIDYINTIYYQFATFAGAAFAIGHGNVALRNHEQRARSGKGSLGLIALGLAALCISICLARQFSLGGYGFDVPIANDPPMQRWFRGTGQIVAYETRERAPFSIFPVIARYVSQIDFEQPTKAFAGSDAIILKNGSKAIGQRYRYFAKNPAPDHQRLLAFALRMPPFQSSLAIVQHKGMGPYTAETNGSVIAVRSCLGQCTMLLRSLDCRGRQLLHIKGTFPVMTVSAIKVEVKVYPVKLDLNQDLINQGSIADATWLQLTSLPVPEQRLSGATLASGIDLPLDADPAADWGWVIGFTSNRPELLAEGQGRLTVAGLSCQEGI